MTIANYLFFIDKKSEDNLKKTQQKFTQTLATFYFNELSILEENLSGNTTLRQIELFIPNIEFDNEKLLSALKQNIYFLKILIYKYTSETEHELYTHFEFENQIS